MNFISISQYLNKLQILFFVLLMVPLLVFIALYFFFPDNPVETRTELLIIIPFAAFVDFILGMTISNKKIKSVRNAQGLGAKLDKYFQITIVRYSFLASAGLLLALGFYLSRSDVFSALYVLSLLYSSTCLPTAASVSDELMLKGDEREMVFYKKDRF
ncbi:MAG TPA: hypothetical protein VFT90_08205 [Chryseosolibacter sp.]|nr:hypothetical protein [Chryseosolibacter sp.]